MRLCPAWHKVGASAPFLCESAWAAIPKCHRLVAQTKDFIFLQFQSRKVQDQGVGQACFLLRLPFWLADGRFLTESSHGFFSACTALLPPSS